MTTISEKHMRAVIEKRRDEITQDGQEYDGPVGEAMERAIEYLGDIRKGKLLHIRHAQHGINYVIWSCTDAAESLPENDKVWEDFKVAAGILVRNPSACSLLLAMAPKDIHGALSQLLDCINAAAGIMCADLAVSAIRIENEEAGRS